MAVGYGKPVIRLWVTCVQCFVSEFMERKRKLDGAGNGNALIMRNGEADYSGKYLPDTSNRNDYRNGHNIAGVASGPLPLPYVAPYGGLF